MSKKQLKIKLFFHHRNLLTKRLFNIKYHLRVFLVVTALS